MFNEKEKRALYQSCREFINNSTYYKNNDLLKRMTLIKKVNNNQIVADALLYTHNIGNKQELNKHLGEKFTQGFFLFAITNDYVNLILKKMTTNYNEIRNKLLEEKEK